MSHEMPERDFSRAKSAADVPALAAIQRQNTGKERITIRLDTAVLAWFREQVHGGGNYQTLINEALKAHIAGANDRLERTLRKIVREELRAAR